MLHETLIPVTEEELAELKSEVERELVPYYQTYFNKVHEELLALREENELLNTLFDMQHKAYCRAWKMWQEAAPGRELTMPDLADQTLFLLTRLDEAEQTQLQLRQEIERLQAKEQEGGGA
jgi:hypothetical protein